ncbi:MAG: crosslink repair DNA glycosylase YcaQ family protein [Ilumatobacteraceae bacterium]
MAIPSIDRETVLRWRFARHQLDRPADSLGSVVDVDLLDAGVQDTGADGSAWALAIRGAPTPVLRRAGAGSDELAIAWTLRGAPHAYRRRDLASVATATAPWSERDAAKRVFDAATTMRRAGMDVLDGLATVAAAMRRIVDHPMVKGDVSRRLGDELGAPFTRFCRPCNAVHLYEQTFRLAALQAGLVLQPGTSPPVLERVGSWAAPAYRRLAGDADERFDVIRNVLRFWGPTTVGDVAGFVDAPAKDVREHWPSDVAVVEVDGVERFVLAGDEPASAGTSGVLRLLGPYDPFLQLRDRELLVPDATRRKAVWPTLGRPGAVVVDGELVAL